MVHWFTFKGVWEDWCKVKGGWLSCLASERLVSESEDLSDHTKHGFSNAQLIRSQDRQEIVPW